MSWFLAYSGPGGRARPEPGEGGILHSRPVTFDHALELHNRGMIAFDLALGAGALAAPARTLAVLGHAAPSDDARELFRRCGPIWLTFAVAHGVAAARGRPEDWWALAWLRGTEMLTDAVWSRSPAFSLPRSRAALVAAGVGNLAMAAAFAWKASKGGTAPLCNPRARARR